MRKHHTEHYSQGYSYLNLLTIAALLISASIFAGCSDDDNDNWEKTKLEGRPSRITSSTNGSIYFYYKSDKLIKIKEDKGSTSNFKYNGNELIEVTYSPTDKNVADGNSITTFSREGNIISAKSSGEPSFYAYTQEIELGDNGLPAKISDKSLKEPGPKGKDLIMAAPTYILYTYDDSGKNLIEKRIYDAKTNQLMTTYNYSYDSKPGIMSKTGLPGWFYIFREDSYNLNFMFLNYTNNLTKLSFKHSSENMNITTNFAYKYTDNGYPSWLSKHMDGDVEEASYDQAIEY